MLKKNNIKYLAYIGVIYVYDSEIQDYYFLEEIFEADKRVF